MKIETAVSKLNADGNATIALTIDKKTGQTTFVGPNSVTGDVSTSGDYSEIVKKLSLKLLDTNGSEKIETSSCSVTVFPKMPYPLASDEWNIKDAKDTLKRFMNILNWRNGGYSYTNKDHEPPGWPASESFKDFNGPKSATISMAKTILRSLLVYHNFDPDKHHLETNNNNKSAKKKKERKSNKSKKSKEFIDEEKEGTDMAAVDLDDVPMLVEDGEGQHYVYEDLVQLPQDGGEDSQDCRRSPSEEEEDDNEEFNLSGYEDGDDEEADLKKDERKRNREETETDTDTETSVLTDDEDDDDLDNTVTFKKDNQRKHSTELVLEDTVHDCIVSMRR